MVRKYGVVDTIDVGRRRILATDHLVQHLLRHDRAGWTIQKSVCNGIADGGALKFRNERAARAAWAELRGEG